LKILIVHGGENRTKLFPVFSLIKKYKIEAFIFSLRSEWSPDKAEKINLYLSECSHFIANLESSDMQNPWSAFFLGYIKGRDFPGYFFLKSDDFNIRKTAFPYPNGESIESLEQYVRNELERDDLKRIKEDALASLSKEGIKPSDEQFVAFVESGVEDKAVLFLKAGFDVNLCNSRKVPLLNLAARKGHLEVLKLLLKNGADVHTISGDRSHTALMDASTEGHVEMVQLLIEAGSDMNVKNTSNQTALILSAGQGKKDVAALLVRAGADTLQKDVLGMSAMKYAKLFNFTDLLQLLDSQANEL